MSKTPICDRWEYDSRSGGLVVPLNVAKDLETELAEARAIINDHIEREAAVCPEDVPFDEYIQALKRQLTEAWAKVKNLKDDKHTNLKEILQLRHDVAEARAEIERLKEWEYCMKTQAPYEAAGATWELRHKHDQAVIAERDKLIEQMREALKQVDAYTMLPNVLASIVDAALSAAERINK